MRSPISEWKQKGTKQEAWFENGSGVFSLTGWISTRVIKSRHMTKMIRRFIVKNWSVIVCVIVCLCACKCALVGMSGIHYDAVTSGCQCRLYWITVIRNQNKWEMKIKNMNMLALNSVSCMSLFFIELFCESDALYTVNVKNRKYMILIPIDSYPPYF